MEPQGIKAVRLGSFYRQVKTALYSPVRRGRRGNMEGRIHSFESFGTVDGPGIRFVVFVQGCPMRCRYCHNPDTWAADGGQIYTAEEVAAEALKYRSYFTGKGGVTVSGG